MTYEIKTENVILGKYSFIKSNVGKAEFVFSTSRGGLNFDKSSSEGKKNLQNIKSWFKVEHIGYLNQIHSSLIHTFDGKIYDGDAIISTEPNTALGIFTADCVPILIADLNKGLTAAIHSGWRGTLDCIVLKTLKLLKDRYMSNPMDLIVVIGPHIRRCCYEISEELIARFEENEIYRGKDIHSNKMLDLEACIKLQLKKFYVPDENIKTIDICTCCSESYEMHSYRKEQAAAGRMFSFVITK